METKICSDIHPHSQKCSIYSKDSIVTHQKDRLLLVSLLVGFYCLNFHLHIAPHMFSLSTLKGMNTFLPYLVFSGLSHLDRLIYLYSYSYEYRYYLYTRTVLVQLGLVSFFILCLNSIECHSKLVVIFFHS
jgi:hypothetical protein